MKKVIRSTKKLNLFLFAFLLIGATACDNDYDSDELETVELRGRKDKEPPAAKPSDKSIAQLAGELGFNELLAALAYVDEKEGAGLVALFSEGTDQYTVFAPTDAAIEALYAALSTDEAPVDEITDLPSSLVLDVLYYHVAEGRRTSKSVVPPVNPREIETLLGESFFVDKDGNITATNSTAGIETPDVSASNGVIHAITFVLLPTLPE